MMGGLIGSSACQRSLDCDGIKHRRDGGYLFNFFWDSFCFRKLGSPRLPFFLLRSLVWSVPFCFCSLFPTTHGQGGKEKGK